MPLTREQRLAKNERIRETGRATRSRHRQMKCTTVMLKIDSRKLNHRQQEVLERQFIEAKWLYNDCLAWVNEDEDRTPSQYAREHNMKTATVKLPDGSFEERELTNLGSQEKQGITFTITQALKALAESKKRGREVGTLKFKTSCNSIPLVQYGKVFKFKSETKMKLQGVPGYVRVHGTNQIPDNAEIACGKLTRKARGYYVAVTFYTPKESEVRTNHIIGIDLGLKHSVITSDGIVFNATVEEPERLKQLQRKLSRQIKGSNNWQKTRQLIDIEYQKMTDRKNDIANKIVHEILSNADVVCMQDEALKAWHRKFGKSVQKNVLGRVKAKLVASPKVIVLKRSVATTKTCICGERLDLTLADREIICPHCGYQNDRDIHAAQNMIRLALEQSNIKSGREPSIALVEGLTSALDWWKSVESKSVSMKQETAWSSAER